MQNYTFVLNTDKIPLQPMHPAAARKLLTSKQAAVYRRYPFTIILKGTAIDDELTTITDTPLEVKLDPGSKTTGIAILSGIKLIFVAELTHRGAAIKASLDSRRAVRNNRRSRHARYRKARYLNRTRCKGWLAPSLKHRVDTTMTWVQKFIRYAPITNLIMELVRFDLQQLENPEISGIQYTQGELHGYEVREYLLNKWDRKCTYCSISNVPLQIEHIQAKANGGTNRISNLCLACDRCNKKKGTQDIKDFLKDKPDVLSKVLSQAKRPLKDAAAVNSTRLALLNGLKSTALPVTTGSGGMTKYNRTKLELPKTHYLDAACVGNVNKLIILTNQPLIITAKGHGRRQMCRTDKYGFPKCYVPRLKYIYGFQTGDIVKAIVTKGKKIGTYVGRVTVSSKGSFGVSGKKPVQSISYRYCSIIHKKDGYSYKF